jgi:4-carboxymuconolactone decarboxylase
MTPDDPTFDAGMAIRREVLGDAHVDRAQANADDFTADFQDFITRYAWGTIWSREGLGRRERSLITLALLAGLGHTEEIPMHVRAALTNGVTKSEIKEVLLHTAVYAGVPAANNAFAVAKKTLDDLGG